MNDGIPRHLREEVYRLMACLPEGKVTTYGDIATYAGHPRAALIIGGIAHRGPDGLPWHRLVNAKGKLASGYPGGPLVQRQLLSQDGIMCNERDEVIEFQLLRWRP